MDVVTLDIIDDVGNRGKTAIDHVEYNGVVIVDTAFGLNIDEASAAYIRVNGDGEAVALKLVERDGLSITGSIDYDDFVVHVVHHDNDRLFPPVQGADFELSNLVR